MAAYYTPTFSTIRFSSQELASEYWSKLAYVRSIRVVDYGKDDHATEPYWLRLEKDVSILCQSAEVQQRWKACGM